QNEDRRFGGGHLQSADKLVERHAKQTPLQQNHIGAETLDAVEKIFHVVQGLLVTDSADRQSLDTVERLLMESGVCNNQSGAQRARGHCVGACWPAVAGMPRFIPDGDWLPPLPDAGVF